MFGNSGPAGMKQMMTIMRKDNGIAELLQQPVYHIGEEGDGEPQVSQADLVADMLNIFRLDAWRMARAQGVDLEIEQMTPEKAAHMLQSLVEGNSIELIDKFNEIEDMNEKVLSEMLTEEELAGHREMKEDLLYARQQTETTLDEETQDALKSVGEAAAAPDGEVSDGEGDEDDEDDEDEEVTDVDDA